ncbi:MAG TPA: ABC transporter permease [Vicinamibacterales bacterium]|nr:ABC transporter permease [Vicinamibacterales bacterium]
MWPERLIQDVRYGVRTLRGSPAFTLVAVTLLALAIGANTAIFSLVSAVLLRPLPFPEPDRLTLLWDDFSAKRGPSRVEPTPADYVDWKARSRSFTDMAAFVAQTYNLTGSGDPDKLEGIRTTANLFTVLGMQAIIGRTLEPSDDDPASGTPVVVINERLWRTRFGADPSFVGRSIDLDGLAHTVVGIVPADFQFPNKEAVFWMPARFTDEERANRTAYNYDILARLEPGTSLSQARAEMATIAQQLAREYPRAYEGVSIAVTPLHEHLTRDTRSAMSILLAAVGLVLCIACANVSNLLLARGAVRRKELAVRKALGAPNALVIRQLLTESAILAGVGASAGVMLSTFAFGYLARLVPGVLPQGTGPMLDARVLLFTTGVAVVMVLGFGTGPAVIAAHVDLDAALKTGATRGTTASDSGRLRNALVVMEVTLTVVLLVGAGLLLRSYARVLDVEPGFRFQHLLIAETALPPSKYRTLESRSAFYQRVLERVSALPEVVSAGYVNFPPLVFKGGRSYISIEGRPTPPPDDFIRYVISDRVVSTGYFAALGVPLVRGRSFDQRDGAEAPRSVIINQKMAITHWPGEDPLGHRIKMGAGESTSPWFTVVGVVGDMRQMGLDTPAEPEMYFSLTQAGATVPFLWPRSLVVRSRGEPLALSTSVRRAVWDVDPDEPVSNIQSMEQVVDIELQSRNMQLTLVGAFAVLALVMAAVGLYGVLSYNVAQRSGEIGVRLALGAQRVTVIAQVVRGALLLVGSGIVLGLASAFVLTRLLTSLLFSISPADPATFLATALLLILTALVASYFPARRSANLDPISVLKSE